jgi:hypothetical protein
VPKTWGGNFGAYPQIGKEVGEELIAKGKPTVLCNIWSSMMVRAGSSCEGVLPNSFKTDKNPALAEMLYHGWKVITAFCAPLPCPSSLPSAFLVIAQ